MKKGTFLNELSNRISKYPDHNDIIQYYNELIQDKIDSGMLEDEAVASLGSVDDICRNIEEQRGIIRTEEINNSNAVNNTQAQTTEPKRMSGGKKFVYVLWSIATVFFCIGAILTLIVAIALLIESIVQMVLSATIIATSISMAGVVFGTGLFIFGFSIVAVHFARVLVKFIFTHRPRWNNNVRKGLAGE